MAEQLILRTQDKQEEYSQPSNINERIQRTQTPKTLSKSALTINLVDSPFSIAMATANSNDTIVNNNYYNGSSSNSGW